MISRKAMHRADGDVTEDAAKIANAVEAAANRTAFADNTLPVILRSRPRLSMKFKRCVTKKLTK